MSSAVEAANLLFRAKNGKVERPYEEPDTVRRARAAVEHLGDRFADLPGSIRDALDAAASSADLLSGDRLQGLSEIVQNADDVGATEVRLLLRPGELLVAHDGAPVQLRDVLALATPWLTTKAGESNSTGRFGIGLMTLRSLSRTLEVHCSPYHLRLGDPTLTALPPSTMPEGVSGEGWTVLRIPLDDGVLSSDELGAWLAGWDDSALLFLRHVERVVRVTPDRAIAARLQLRWATARSVPDDVGGHPVEVMRRLARAQDGRSWLVYSVDTPVPPDVERTRKATGETTPIAVALPLRHSDGGFLYAGLPITPTRVQARVNAQFDPLTSRQGLASTSWNAALLPLLADLWVVAVVDLFRTRPSAGWSVVPLPRSDDPDLEPASTDRLEDLLVERARSSLTERLRFSVPGDADLPLSDLAAEVPRLERVLSAGQVASLAGTPAALPSEVRDRAGRWRHVLDDWRSAGADLPDLVQVADALELLGDDLDAETTVGIAAAAIDCGLGGDLAERPCVVTDDGRNLIPPAGASALVLLVEPVPLAEQLGMARRLDPVHLDDSDVARTVLAWLRELGAVLDAADPAAVVHRIAAIGRAGYRLIEPLTDVSARALRGAFEMLTPADRNRFGADVGRAILLSGYTYDKGRRTPVHTRPVDAYLPKSIERETDGFAEAAAKTPGLTWLDSRYAEVLRSPAGRGGVGALRFLRLLGAENAPRPRPHPERTRRYSDSRLGVWAWIAGGPEARQAYLNSIGATYTLDDYDNPHLQAVIVDIAREKAVRRRRKRAAALLTALSRAWDRLNEHAEVPAAHDDYGWNLDGSVRAFWLWQADDVAWLDDTDGRPSRPQDLRLRAPATVAVYGPDARGYLHRELDSRNHRMVLAAFGLAGEPSTIQLVDRLRDLRDVRAADDSPAAGVHTEAAVVYQALAERVARPARGSKQMGRMRAAFQQGAGLILTQRGWRRPDDALTGPPVFGRFRAFVPAVPNTDDLWRALPVPQPSTRDCVEVLHELARQKAEPVADDAAIMLDTLHLLLHTLTEGDVDQSMRRRLGRLPLWTSNGWTSKRPVYATDDPSLADGLGDTVPFWQPGATIEQFRSLIGPLLLTELSPADTEVIDGSSAEDDPDLTDLLQAAVRLLRNDLARNDQQAARSLTLSWSQLEQLRVRVDPGLTVRIRHAVERGLPETVEVRAKADVERGIILVRSTDLVAKVGGGGRAIAGLFSAHHRRIAQAWRSAWDEAESGRQAHELILADQKAAEIEARTKAEIEARTTALQSQITKRHRGRTNESVMREPSTPPITAPAPTGWQEPAAARTLVDPAMLRLRDPDGRLVGSARRTSGPPSGTPGRHKQPVVPPRTDGSPPRSRVSPPTYTANSKEAVGLNLVIEVLGSDAEQIVDLRTQAGVGADAMDDLRQFYELKVHAGNEPDRVTLTGSEVQRAHAEPGFFLVVVSNVEGANATPRVRIIANPLDQLQPIDNGNLTLTGIREAHGIVFDFEHDEPDDHAGSEQVES